MNDVIIIGAGVNGCFLARDLSKYKLNILVLEKMDYTKHPYAKNIVRTSIMDYSPIAPSDSFNETEAIVLAKAEEKEKPKRKNKVKEIYVDLPLDSV